MLDRDPRPVEPRTEFELQRELERRATRRLALVGLALYVTLIVVGAWAFAQAAGGAS